MSEQVIKEGSANFLTITFKNEDDTLIVPTTVDWRIDNKTAGVEILDWASLTPASSILQTISGLLNVLTSQDSVHELFVVTIRADDGLATQAFQSHHYRVKNLYGQT